MSANPNWQIFKIDMSIAGSQDVPGMFSYLRVIRAIAASGIADLDAVIYCQPRQTGGDPIPLQLNSLIKLPAKTDWLRFTWDAQPGTTIWIFVSDQDNAAGIEIEAPPTKQLVTSSIGTTITQSAIVVGVAAVSVAAANASRQSVTILNAGTVPIYYGNATVTTVNGMKVEVGQTATIDKTTAAIFAISGTAAQDVRVVVEA